MELLLMLWLAFAGLACGSFVNAYVYRVYMAEFAPKKQRRKLSVLTGRSLCPHCNHQLAAKDLLPLLSWLQLKGKCRYCGARISLQYPLVELSGAALFVGQYIFWPYGFEGLLWLAFTLWLIMNVLFLALMVADVKWMLLPNKMLLPLVIVTVIWLGVLAFEKGAGILSPAALSAVLFGGFFHLLFQISAGKWIGGGDVKLGYILGIVVLQPYNVLLAMFLASVLALAYYAAVSVMRSTPKQNIIPFGPFLMFGAIAVALATPDLSTLLDSYFVM